MTRLKNYEFYSAKGTKGFYFQKFNSGLSTRYWIEIQYIIGFTFSLRNKV